MNPAYRERITYLRQHPTARVHVPRDAWLLFYAVKTNQLADVQLVLGRGANVRASDDYALRLAVATRGTDVAIVSELLVHGANVHVCDDAPLYEAAYGGHESIVRLLLDRGANVHACEDQALYFAVAKKHVGIVHVLLEHGANMFARDGEMMAGIVNMLRHSDDIQRRAAFEDSSAVFEICDVLETAYEQPFRGLHELQPLVLYVLKHIVGRVLLGRLHKTFCLTDKSGTSFLVR